MPVYSNEQKLRYRVNEFFDIRDVLKKMGYDRVEYGNRIRCPNHDDRHPDAEIYEEGDMLYCHACRQGWTSYDLLTRFMDVPKSKLNEKTPELDSDFEPEKIEKGYNLDPIKREWFQGDVDTKTMVTAMLDCVGKGYKLVNKDDLNVR